MQSSMKPVESKLQSGPNASSLTKSQLLLLLSEGLPEFPLSKTMIASVAHVPGQLPTSLDEFINMLRVDTGHA